MKERNHFQNRKYVEFNPELHLASWGWKNHKYHGKKINIVAHSSHPSFAFDAAEAKQKYTKLVIMNYSVIARVHCIYNFLNPLLPKYIVSALGPVKLVKRESAIIVSRHR